MSGRLVLVVLAVLLAGSGLAAQEDRWDTDPDTFLCTWLVTDSYTNGADNAGYDQDWIGEATVQPHADATWRYFDDRLFSRNYDSYNDLYSYFRVKRGQSVAARVAYAHTYLYVPVARPAVQLGLAYHAEYKAWLNGTLVGASTTAALIRNGTALTVTLNAGWNRLLLKIANQGEGPFGFYASLSDGAGHPVPGLIASVEGGGGALAVATRSMAVIASSELPTAYRDWPYVGADAAPYLDPIDQAAWRNHAGGWHLGYLVKAPGLRLQARGGTPPYRWTLGAGTLPDGLALDASGLLIGTVSGGCRLGSWPWTATVTDAAGHSASQTTAITVNERPNRWVERCGLIGLVCAPENLSAQQIHENAVLMRREGYGLAVPIGYGNGAADDIPRWPSEFQPVNPYADVLATYKRETEAQGMRFGLYLGELELAKNRGQAGLMALCDEAYRMNRPAVIWFDNAGRNYELSDAFFSMWRAYDPDLVLIKNGQPTKGSFDWDMLCCEGWQAWGTPANTYDVWPDRVPWFKRHRLESWRFIPDPAMPASWGKVGATAPTWQAYVPVFLSLIGEGHVADLDHTVSWTAGAPFGQVYQLHEGIAAWANPPGHPSLLPAYTDVEPGPFDNGRWGYNVITPDRRTVYVYILANGVGRSGFFGLGLGATADQGDLVLAHCRVPVHSVTLMNQDRALAFTQTGDQVRIGLVRDQLDPAATILKIALAAPHPTGIGADCLGVDVAGQVNLAYRKPVRMLSLDGVTELGASGLHDAIAGVDGKPSTFAEAAYQWPWIFHVDLGAVATVGRLVVLFGPARFPTEYRILVSEDSVAWREVAYAKDGTGRDVVVPDAGRLRFVRVCGLRPDGEGQPGYQMSISELQVFAAVQSVQTDRAN